MVRIKTHKSELRSATIRVTVTPRLKRKVERAAQHEDRSESDYVRLVLQKEVG